MVTNYPQEVAAPPMTASARETADTMVGRAVAAVQHAFCSLRGHDNLLHFDHNRMCLRCTSCGHETPGWEIDGIRPRLRFHGDPERQLARTRFAAARRIA
jgi:NADH:ubiquinone oxidoreductase subunit F (NADH-binding)